MLGLLLQRSYHEGVLSETIMAKLTMFSKMCRVKTVLGNAQKLISSR